MRHYITIQCGREPFLGGGTGEWSGPAELGLVSRIILCIGHLFILCIELGS